VTAAHQRFGAVLPLITGVAIAFAVDAQPIVAFVFPATEPIYEGSGWDGLKA